MKARRNVCVIVLSNEADAHLSDEVVRCGGIDLLTRPFKRQQVLPMLVFAYTFCRGHGPFLRARRKSAPRDFSLAGNA
jgi:FixJ family two-component response regulator